MLVTAQPARQRSVSIGTGLSFGALRDDAVSALTRRGTAFPLALQVSSRGSRSWHDLQVGYTSFSGDRRLSSAYGNASTAITGRLAYTYHRRLWTLGKWAAGAGAAVALQSYYLQNIDGMGNSFNATMLTTLDPSVGIGRAVGRSWLEAQASAALLGYAIRPSYALAYLNVDTPGEGLRSGKLEIWPQLGVFRAQITCKPTRARYSRMM